ncbi:hypothetical protein GALL_438840 [mine drainage metagenome]|uniref:Uncharacterized protein n=1 Tax=mine drainage metagenome TaxID=410659 RepID=A0A1J5Q389_9ZZZZ
MLAAIFLAIKLIALNLETGAGTQGKKTAIVHAYLGEPSLRGRDHIALIDAIALLRAMRPAGSFRHADITIDEQEFSDHGAGAGWKNQT